MAAADFHLFPRVLPGCVLTLARHNLSVVNEFVTEQARRLRQIQSWRSGRDMPPAIAHMEPMRGLLEAIRPLADAELHRFEEITGRDCIPWWHAHGPSFTYFPAQCCGRREAIRRAAMMRRPKRSVDEPYLYNFWGLECSDMTCSSRQGISQLLRRADVLWVAVDLNDHVYSNDSCRCQE